MTEVQHPGFPPRYWDMLAKAAQEMDKAEACSDCMVKWRNHGPSHYRAFRNIEHCGECAIRSALPVERAVLDWQYDHDPLKAVVKKIVDSYRTYKSAKEGFREIMRNWSKYLDEYEEKGGPAPGEIRDDRIQKDIAAMKSFWQAITELDSIIPKHVKEEER